MNSMSFPKPLMIAVVATMILFLTVIGVGLKTNVAPIVRAASWDRVKAYQYEKTPGLKRAEMLGLTRSFQIKVPVPGTDLILSLYEVWYNREHVYIFYSFERINGGFGKPLKDGEAPVLSFQATLPDPYRDTFVNQSYSLNWLPWEGAQHQGKYHQRLVVAPFLDADRTALVTKIDEMVLRQVTVQWEDHTYAIPELRLPMNIDMESEQVVKVPLNGSHSLMGRRIEYDRMELGTSMNKLYFRFHSSGDHETLLGISGKIRTDEGEERRFHGGYGTEADSEGKLAAVFPPFDRSPAGMRIVLESVRWMDRNSSLQFQLNAGDFQKYIKHPDDTYRQETRTKLASLENTDVYLKSLHYDAQGLYFTIAYEEKRWLRKPFIRLMADTPNAAAAEGRDERMPLTVTAFNERGEPGTFGGRGSGGRTFGMLIERTFIESSERMDVTIGNLVKEIVGEWEDYIVVPAAPSS